MPLFGQGMDCDTMSLSGITCMGMSLAGIEAFIAAIDYEMASLQGKLGDRAMVFLQN